MTTLRPPCSDPCAGTAPRLRQVKLEADERQQQGPPPVDSFEAAAREWFEVKRGADVKEETPFVDTGRVITSAGTAAGIGIGIGISISLHLVERVLGAKMAAATARPSRPPSVSWRGGVRRVTV